jgi:hypothetical protein
MVSTITFFKYQNTSQQLRSLLLLHKDPLLMQYLLTRLEGIIVQDTTELARGHVGCPDTDCRILIWKANIKKW